MNLTITLIMTGIVGLIVGSFLNVVIVRLPKMLEAKWQKECHEFLESSSHTPQKTFNLLIPKSHCPHCNAPIKLKHNIPLLSYLLLRGRCAYCHKKISPLYPTVELITCLLTIAVVVHFAVSYTAFAAVLLTWVLIAIFFIDLKTQLIPDEITLTTLWLGLFLSLYYVFISPSQAILGAIVGYGILWIVASAFQLIRKKQGMGYGDFKMLGMLGAWLGPSMIINTLLIAVILGLGVALILLTTKKITAQRPIPFGPYLAIAGWLSLVFGPFLLQWITAP